MNYLAHLYLAEADPGSRIGSLLGDFYKGPPDPGLDPAVRGGIILHRQIDAFTDAHPRVLASKRRLQPQFRRYGGILVDIFYDHFLATEWEHYSSVPLRQFTGSVHRTLIAHYPSLPAAMQRSVDYMIAHDLLLSYREVAGIGRALRGVAGRLRRPNPLGEAAAELERLYPSLAADFAAFFPELIDFTGRTTPPERCRTDRLPISRSHHLGHPATS